MKKKQQPQRTTTPTTTPEANGNGESTPVRLPAMLVRQVKIPIIGVTSLLVLRFSEKARNMMLGKQMGEAKAGKEPKDPLALFKESYYSDKDGFIFPSVCFKAAGVNCANDIEEKQTEMRRAFFVLGDWVRIEAPPLEKEHWSEWDHKYAKDLKWEHEHGCSMVHAMVRNASGVADIRFRSCFPVWKATLPVEFNEAIITLEKLMMLMTVAGFGNGIGEWRPASKESKTGTHGRWRLMSDDKNETSS
jgi:hypothetical protein